MYELWKREREKERATGYLYCEPLRGFHKFPFSSDHFESARADHVFRIFQKLNAGPRRFKSRSQGVDPGPSQGSSRISPTPHRVYKEEAEAEDSVQLSEQTDRPPPFLYQQKSSLDKHALLEVTLAPGTPPGIFPLYPCIGHFPPPSPLAASFKRAASPGPTAQSPPRLSKSPC